MRYYKIHDSDIDKESKSTIYHEKNMNNMNTTSHKHNNNNNNDNNNNSNVLDLDNVYDSPFYYHSYDIYTGSGSGSGGTESNNNNNNNNNCHSYSKLTEQQQQHSNVYKSRLIRFAVYLSFISFALLGVALLMFSFSTDIDSKSNNHNLNTYYTSGSNANANTNANTQVSRYPTISEKAAVHNIDDGDTLYQQQQQQQSTNILKNQNQNQISRISSESISDSDSNSDSSDNDFSNMMNHLPPLVILEEDNDNDNDNHHDNHHDNDNHHDDDSDEKINHQIYRERNKPNYIGTNASEWNDSYLSKKQKKHDHSDHDNSKSKNKFFPSSTNIVNDKVTRNNNDDNDNNNYNLRKDVSILDKTNTVQSQSQSQSQSQFIIDNNVLKIKLTNEYGDSKNSYYPFLSESSKSKSKSKSESESNDDDNVDILFMEPHRPTKVHLFFTDTSIHSESESESDSNNNDNIIIFEDEMFYEFEITINQQNNMNFTNNDNDNNNDNNNMNSNKNLNRMNRNMNMKNSTSTTTTTTTTKVLPMLNGAMLNRASKVGNWIVLDDYLTVGMMDNDDNFHSNNIVNEFHIKINVASSSSSSESSESNAQDEENESAESVIKSVSSSSSTTCIYDKSYPLVVKYVRRELRTLLVNEKEEFLDAMYKIFHLSQDDGVEKYGTCFYNIEFFINEHVNLAGAHDCDHGHEGMGFLNFHNKLTIEFEKVLQCINSKLSMAYWDFTIDGTDYMLRDGDLSKLSETWLTTGLYTDEWFGSADPDTGKIINSRWKDLKVSHKNSDSKIFNAHDQLRAPWNLNPSEYITRYATQCGDAFEAHNSEIYYPTCAIHYKMIYHEEYNALSDWNTAIQLAPHGPMHLLSGGMFGCKDSFDSGLNFGFSKEEINLFKANSFKFLKISYRDDVMDCPQRCTDGSDECFCTCKNYLTNSTAVNTLLSNLFGRDYNTLMDTHDYEDCLALLESICQSPIYLGDQIESGSPADPSFWPIHGTIERLYQYRRIRNDFTDILWKDSSNGECYGHGENDTYYWTISSENESNDKSKNIFTNLEYMKFGDPTNENQYQLNYIYDNFQWNHCEGLGFEFEKDKP